MNVIETVKHFFSVAHVHFVLVFNAKQMESIVKCAYGVDIDAAKYIQKFYSILYSIPEDSGNAVHYMKKLWKLHIYTEPLAPILELKESLENILEMNKSIDFRTIEHIIMHVKYATSIRSLNRGANMIYCASLLVLKYHRPKVFEGIRDGKSVAYEKLDGLNMGMYFNGGHGSAISFKTEFNVDDYDKNHIMAIVNSITS